MVRQDMVKQIMHPKEDWGLTNLNRDVPSAVDTGLHKDQVMGYRNKSWVIMDAQSNIFHITYSFLRALCQ